MKKLIFLSLMAICFCVRLYAQTNFKYKNAYLQPIITQYFASNKSEIWP